jgi:FdhE protein
VAALHPDALWQLAEVRWKGITADRPDLAAAVALQQRLLRILLEASAALDLSAVVPVPESSIVEKWGRGLPILYNQPVTIPSQLKGFLPSICVALAEGGAGESADHIGQALAIGKIDADSMLRVSLTRNRKAIRTGALHLGLAPDLLWLIAELGSAPLAHHLTADLTAFAKAPAVRRSFTRRRKVGTTETPHWDHGYCPFCGSWPAFIESSGGFRILRCSFCAFGWPLSCERCIYCANQNADFVRAALDVERTNRAVELCASCGGYTKVIDVTMPTPFPLVAVEDLATIDLDGGAMERGYRRPDLVDLEGIEPLAAT